MALSLTVRQAETLESLDRFGSLDALPVSLDASRWKGLSLEDLDQFGALDRLPHSLDDPYWEGPFIGISGRSVSPSAAARARGRKVFFGGPRRSVSPAGTRLREDWLLRPEAAVSVSPAGIRRGLTFLFPGLTRLVSPGAARAGAVIKISPVDAPLRLVSPGSAMATARFRGHGWITRAV